MNWFVYELTKILAIAALFLGFVLGFSLLARPAPKPALAISRPWFPREATMPADERELKAYLENCNVRWDGLSMIERDPCRLECSAEDRTALWTHILSESVCERLR